MGIVRSKVSAFDVALVDVEEAVSFSEQHTYMRDVEAATILQEWE